MPSNTNEQRRTRLRAALVGELAAGLESMRPNASRARRTSMATFWQSRTEHASSTGARVIDLASFRASRPSRLAP